MEPIYGKNNKEELPLEFYLKRFQAGDPAEMAQRCALPYDRETGTITMDLLGETFSVSHPDFTVVGPTLLSNGERIIAFSMGSRMNRDYYDVGFEKAFPDVNGAYAMINREFSRMIAEKYPEVQFLNREDDMGSEGLRRAKESYQPTVLLEKYVADWKGSV